MVTTLSIIVISYLLINQARRALLRRGYNPSRRTARVLNYVGALSLTVIVSRLSKQYRSVAPASNPAPWNTDTAVADHNCYSVALGVLNGRFGAVGAAAVKSTLLPSLLRKYQAAYGATSGWTPRNTTSFEAFVLLLEGDGLVRATLRNLRLRNRNFLVAALFEPGSGRYHFIRLGAEGTWMEKNGECPAEVLEGGRVGMPVSSKYGPNYLLVGYYWVNPSGKAREHCALELGLHVSNLALL